MCRILGQNQRDLQTHTTEGHSVQLSMCLESRMNGSCLSVCICEGFSANGHLIQNAVPAVIWDLWTLGAGEIHTQVYYVSNVLNRPPPILIMNTSLVSLWFTSALFRLWSIWYNTIHKGRAFYCNTKTQAVFEKTALFSESKRWKRVYIWLSPINNTFWNMNCKYACAFRLSIIYWL